MATIKTDRFEFDAPTYVDFDLLEQVEDDNADEWFGKEPAS